MDTKLISSYSSKEILTCFLHEIHHCYMYCLIDAFSKLEMDEESLRLYHFQYLDQIAEEIKHFQIPGEDSESRKKYNEQKIEIFARVVSKNRCESYFQAIEGMLNEAQNKSPES